jgi:hypothetical protein
MANQYLDIPQAGDILATSQGQLEHNFLYLANTLGTSLKSGDHQIAVNDSDTATFEGRHLQVCLKNRNAMPPTVSGIGDGTDSLIYSNNGNLFFGSVTGAGAFQLTTYNSNTSLFGTNTVYATASGQTFNGGWTFLPGGLILQYGTITNPTSGSTGTCPFPISFPNACFGVTDGLGRAPYSSASHQFYPGVISTNQFTFSTESSSNKIYWMAIGN